MLCALESQVMSVDKQGVSDCSISWMKKQRENNRPGGALHKGPVSWGFLQLGLLMSDK